MFDLIDNEDIKGIEKTAEFEKYKDLLPRGYISISQVSQYMKCGEAYYNRYILEKATPSTSYQVQGRGVHKAAEVLHLNMIEGVDLSEEEMVQTYSDLHDAEIADVEIDAEEGTTANVKDVGILLTKEYHKVALGHATDLKTGFPIARVRPIAAEKMHRVTLDTPEAGKIPFVGVIDLEEEDAISDLKTKKKPSPRTEADNSIQLSLYAHVTGKARVRLDQLVKPTKTLPARFIRLEAVRTKKEVAHALDIVSEVADDIAAGRFRKTTPDAWWCTEKWCPYWQDCRGKNR